MFNKALRSLFWKQKYEDFWHRHGFHFGGVSDPLYGPLSINIELLKWDRKLDEKKSYWGDKGKGRGYTPEQAAFHAMQETANEYYAEFADKEDMEETWRALADKLHFVAGCAREPDTYEGYHGRLSEHWKQYYKKIETERQASTQRGEEVRSYRFQQEDVVSAWNKLIAGDAPGEARRVWRAMPIRIKTAHEIAEESRVSIARFVFWMVVFRDGGLVQEYPHDEPKYVRQGSGVPSLPPLEAVRMSEDQKAALHALNRDEADR